MRMYSFFPSYLLLYLIQREHTQIHPCIRVSLHQSFHLLTLLFLCNRVMRNIAASHHLIIIVSNKKSSMCFGSTTGFKYSQNLVTLTAIPMRFSVEKYPFSVDSELLNWAYAGNQISFNVRHTKIKNLKLLATLIWKQARN